MALSHLLLPWLPSKWQLEMEVSADVVWMQKPPEVCCTLKKWQLSIETLPSPVSVRFTPMFQPVPVAWPVKSTLEILKLLHVLAVWTPMLSVVDEEPPPWLLDCDCKDGFPAARSVAPRQGIRPLGGD